MNNKQREKDFKKAAEEYDDSPDVVQRIIARTGVEFGAEYGYQYAIDKACEWLENNAYLYVDDIDKLHESALIGDFRKAMEE